MNCLCEMQAWSRVFGEVCKHLVVNGQVHGAWVEISSALGGAESNQPTLQVPALSADMEVQQIIIICDLHFRNTRTVSRVAYSLNVFKQRREALLERSSLQLVSPCGCLVNSSQHLFSLALGTHASEYFSTQVSQVKGRWTVIGSCEGRDQTLLLRHLF